MKQIIAEYIPDWVEPYKRMGLSIPVVTKSDHPKFKVGSRFDYGFMRIALDDGYSVEILQQGWHL